MDRSVLDTRLTTNGATTGSRSPRCPSLKHRPIPARGKAVNGLPHLKHPFLKLKCVAAEPSLSTKREPSPTVASDVKESCKLLRCTVATFTAAATLHLSGVQPALAQEWQPQARVEQTTTNQESSQNLLLAPLTASPSDILPTLVEIITNLASFKPAIQEVRYSELMRQAEAGKISHAQFAAEMDTLYVWNFDSKLPQRVTLLGLEENVDELAESLHECGVDVAFAAGMDETQFWTVIAQLILLEIAAVQLVVLVMMKLEIFPFGMGRKYTKVENVDTTFDNVAGCDIAKLELQEIVEFLAQPEKYEALGAKIPKGVLLSGPPGTGKTLLARALAGEANCNFFTQSASSFVEVLAGVGSQRVTSLFNAARSADGPSIIFIDEIDALGKQRTNRGGGGAQDERDQTLNQLLVEMDGFCSATNVPVVVIAATNQPDLLDNALKRPGRFDRHVHVGLPDLVGRLDILHVHGEGRRLADNVDLAVIARRTTGFSGAQLSAVVNEGAIAAAREDCQEVAQTHLESGLERLLMGPARVLGSGQAGLSEDRRRLLAYHEAGHAIVSTLTRDVSDEVAKVTIIPRGGVGGHTTLLPKESQLESGLYSRRYLEARMKVALGGRVAEELIYGKENVTTSASDDLRQVSDLAQKMVKEFGFGKSLGQQAMARPSAFAAMNAEQLDGLWTYQHLLASGGGGVGNIQISKATANQIDNDVRQIIETAHTRTHEMLRTHEAALHTVAEALLEHETVSGVEVREMCEACGITLPPLQQN